MLNKLFGVASVIAMAVLGSQTLKNNGVTVLTSNSSSEAVNNVTTSTSSLTLGGGSMVSSSSIVGSPLYVHVTNTGSSDSYVSAIPGGSTFYVPAGQDREIYTGSTPLYAYCPSGSTTLKCIQEGY